MMEKWGSGLHKLLDYTLFHFRNYEDEEERKAIFFQTLLEIEEHNLLYEQGISTYFQGINFFADLTWNEFQDGFLMSAEDNQV